MAEGLRWQITKAVRASDLPAPSRLIMLVLADVAQAGTAEIPERFTPSLAVLASETGLDSSTVKRHLAALVKAKWIDRSTPDAKAQGRGERTRYRLTLPPERVPHPGAQDARGPGAESATPRRTVPPTPAHSAPPDTDLSDQGQIPPSSPPPAAGSPPVRHEEGEEANPEETDLVGQVLAIRPEWSPRSVRRALRDLDVAARPWSVVAAAMLAVARDPASTAPGRLRGDGPWWTAAAARQPTPSGLPPPCGKCGPGRLVEIDDDKAVRCPNCHPLRSGAAA